jgi:hypothetical protein
MFANAELITESALRMIDAEIGSQKPIDIQNLMQEIQQNDFNQI